jgi:hypothetical protein
MRIRQAHAENASEPSTGCQLPSNRNVESRKICEILKVRLIDYSSTSNRGRSFGGYFLEDRRRLCETRGVAVGRTGLIRRGNAHLQP